MTVLSPLVLYDCDDPVRFKLLNNGVTVLTIEPYFIREQTIESQQLPAEAGLLGNSSWCTFNPSSCTYPPSPLPTPPHTDIPVDYIIMSIILSCTHRGTCSGCSNYIFLSPLSSAYVRCCHGDHGSTPHISPPAASTGGWLIPRGAQSPQLRPRRGYVSSLLRPVCHCDCTCSFDDEWFHGGGRNCRSRVSACVCKVTFQLPGHTER